jgi:hypothetical protein
MFDQHSIVFYTHSKTKDRSGLQSVDLEHLIFRSIVNKEEFVEFIRRGNTLIVLGSFGSAVYEFGATYLLEMAASFDINYFCKKCVAAEFPAMTWGPDIAWTRVCSVLKKDEEFSRFGELKGVEALDSREDWASWLEKNGIELFGSDFWSFAYDIGLIPSEKCTNQLRGLKQAVAKLLEEQEGL